MIIFNSYVKLPEGTSQIHQIPLVYQFYHDFPSWNGYLWENAPFSDTPVSIDIYI